MKPYLLSIIPLLILPVGLLGLPACTHDNDEIPLAQPVQKETSIVEPQAPIVITIGNFTDLTGPSSNALTLTTMAMENIVKYYNEQNLIPGVKYKVITYDGQTDPAKDIPGYEWLRENGADLIFTTIPYTPTTLKSKVNEDEVVLFTASGDIDAIEPPGYIFSLGTIPQHEAYSLLKWIAENDIDFPQGRPARIGGAGWSEVYSSSWFTAAEEYAAAHPDQYEWLGGYLTNFSFTWGPEVEALKDADYVYPGIVMHTFVREYRAEEYLGKFIGTSAQTAFLGMIYDSGLWDEIDSSLFIFAARWWNEEGTLIDMNKQLLYRNHPDEVDEIIRQGRGYLTAVIVSQMLDIIGNAVEKVGPENFNSHALYEAAETYSRTVDGVRRYSFGKNKRWMTDMYAIYEANGADQDLYRVDPEWLPVVTSP